MSVLNNTYNLTELIAANNTLDLVNAANTYSHGILLNMFLFGLWIIILLSLSEWEFAKAFIIASFACTIVSMLFAIAFISTSSIFAVIVFLALTAFGSFAAVIGNSFRR